MATVNLKVDEHSSVCSYCKREIETEIDNEIVEKQEILENINEEMKFIDIIKKSHIVCKQLENMKTIGLKERDFITILMDRTKMNRADVSRVVSTLRQFESSEFSSRIDSLESLINNLKDKFR